MIERDPMNQLQLSALGVMAMFYTSYFCKMILQRKQGIQTDQIAKGDKPPKVLRIEFLMKIATYLIVPVELISICGKVQMWDNFYCWIGIMIATVGILTFILAMLTMRDSWRAGIPESDKTELVTNGIYRFSRNPAFLGFDLMYIGLLISFFNLLHLIVAVFAIIMLHLQILQEEVFLGRVFGEDYVYYKEHTGRYFIIKKTKKV